jgi:signal transduction histidine kinase
MENSVTISNVIKNLEIFSEVEDEVVQFIISKLTEVRFNNGEVVFSKGDEGDALFFIVEGGANVHDGEHLFSQLFAGQAFGEYSLLDKAKRSATVTANSPLLLYRLGKDDFTNIILSNTAFCLGVLRMMVNRSRSMNLLEEKLGKSYLEIQMQKLEIERQHKANLQQKQQLETINHELIKLNQEKNSLINLVAHDLRNPLTSSLCVMEMFIENQGNLTEDQMEYLKVIESSLKRMHGLVNQILDVEVIESHNLNLNLQAESWSLILKEVVNTLKSVASRKGISIMQLDEPITAVTDRNLLAQIFDNLISNAIKYSPPESVIQIKLLNIAGIIRFEVKDQGPGIKQDEMPRLFNQYQKPSNKPTAGEKSTGLGLSIVKKYVNALNGEVWCESTPGRGSNFIVVFELEK